MNTPTLRLAPALPGIMALLLCSCSSMQVQTAADPQTDLSRYKTFAWAPLEGSKTEGLLDQTLRSSVERELAAKGMQPNAESPDLLIRYFAASHDTVNYGPAPGYGYPAYPYYGNAYVTREGSLTMQFYDPKTRRIVWQGTATDVIGDAGASQKQVAQAVKELFERYPNTG